MERNEYYKLAQDLLGIPYRHGGRDKEGIDCLGLLCLFYKKLGINLPDHDGQEYSLDWYKKDPERFWRGLQQVGEEVSLATEPLKPLDLVYFKIGGAITHAAVMLDEHSFLHVMSGQRVHITRLTRAWKRRLKGARRLL
ncbi:MAG: C40 family peptidase [Firmicutes bacterium]|nr:C40 family peptidase [Bacillota bacterium]